MGIQRYIFFSIFDCDKHPEVPLMNIKSSTEKFLASSKVPHTTLRLTGFHQVREPNSLLSFCMCEGQQGPLGLRLCKVEGHDVGVLPWWS